MPRYRIQTPGGEELLVEGDHFPTEEELGTISQEMFPKPSYPTLGESPTFADFLKQPKTPVPESTSQPLPEPPVPDFGTKFAEVPGVTPEEPRPEIPDVVQQATPGELQPNEAVPTIRLVGGKVVLGEYGDTHPDIIKRHDIKAEDIDQRGFFARGKFWPRIPAAVATQIPTERHPPTETQPGELHSTDLPAIAGEQPPASPEALAVQRAQGERKAAKILQPFGAKLPQWQGYDLPPNWMTEAPLPELSTLGQIKYGVGAPLAILEKEGGAIAADLMQEADRIIGDKEEDRPKPFRNFMAAVMEAPEEPLPRELELAGRKDWSGAAQNAAISAGRLFGLIAGAELTSFGAAGAPVSTKLGGAYRRSVLMAQKSPFLVPAAFGAATYARTLDDEAALESAGMGAAWMGIGKVTDELAGGITKQMLLNKSITKAQAKVIEQSVKQAGMQAVMHGLSVKEYAQDPENWRNTFANNTAIGLMFGLNDIVKSLGRNAKPLGVEQIRRDVQGWLQKLGPEMNQAFAEEGWKLSPEEQTKNVDALLARYEKLHGSREGRPLKKGEFTLLELKDTLKGRAEFEKEIEAESKKTGFKFNILKTPGYNNDVANANPDGSIDIPRRMLHRWREKLTRKGMTPKEAAKLLVSHEAIHSAARTMENGDAQAEALWAILPRAVRLALKAAYPKGAEPDTPANLGHEAIRMMMLRAQNMPLDEFMQSSLMDRAWSRAWIKFAEIYLKYIEPNIKGRAMHVEGVADIMRRVRENVEAARKRAQDALVTEAAPVLRPVREAPREGKREMPVAERRLTDDERRRQEGLVKEVQVPLEAKAPPAAPAVEGPPAAPVKAPEVAVAKPGTPPVAPAAPAKEPTISKPITEAKVPQVPPEQAELRTLTETLRERDLTSEEQDRLDELIARGVRPAMRARQEDIARETYTRFIGTRNREDHYLWSSPDAGKAIEIIVPEGADAEAVRAKVRERVGMTPAMRARDPEEHLKQLAEAPRVTGDKLVTIVSDNGRRQVAAYNPAKVWDLTEVGMGKLVQVGYWNGEAWSHGPIRPGDRVMEDGGKSGAEFETTGSSAPAMRAKPDYEYIGHVYAGVVDFKRARPLDLHEDTGFGRGARWRYDKANNEVSWSDVPNQEDIAAVDNALARRGIEAKRHTSWVNPLASYRDESAPAMRVRDMDDEQLRNYLMPIIAAAGNDPVKRQEAYDRVVAQMDAEEQAEFEQESVATEMAVPPEIAESLKAIDDKTIPRAMENYLNSSIDPKPMTAKQLKPDYDFPDFRKFSKSVRDMIPGTTEDMLREMWVDKAYEHLLNASGERLAAWRAAFKLEGARRYGTRTIPDPPRAMTAEEKNDFVRQVINMDPAEQREFMEERRKANEAGQKYRRRLITEMITRLAAQALPELRAPVNREGVTPDDIDFEHSKTRLGAYRTFSKGEQDNEGFLQLWLDDFARPSKSARATRTKRLTVVVDRTTGDVNIVSTYGHPTKGKGIMLYDPETDPVFPPTPDKKHRRLGEVMQRFRVKASILLRDPVERFHMRITADPETGRSAEQVYMDLIGEHGEAVESHIDKIWNDFQGERAEEREEATAAAEEERELRAGPPPKTAAEAASLIAREEAGEPPPSAVERGEGGIVTGKHADIARAQAGILRSNLRYFARGPMTSREADGLAAFVEDMNVVKFSDMRKGLAKIHELAQKVYWTGERRGLRGIEYTALSAIDKVVKSEYFKLRQEPQTKERIDQIKDKEARAKYLEGVKMDALSRALIKIYDLAEKYKTKYEYAGTPHFDLNRTGFSVEILDSYGDRTRRAFESAAAQELAPPESGARTLLLGKERPGVPRVRGEALMRFPPRERPGPRGMLSPEAERYTREEAKRAYPYFQTLPQYHPVLMTPKGAEAEMARRGKGFVPKRQAAHEAFLARKVGGETRIFPTTGPETVIPGRPQGIPVEEWRGPAMRARTYGISERSREERIASGMGLPMAPNEGLRTEDSIIRGRELIQAGTNPEQIMARFEADPAKRFGSEDVAVVRAHGENLYRKSITAEEQAGRKSPQFREAFRNLANWETRMRPMLNEWGRSGKAMQGEADVDTGEFVDMARKFRENTGRDFTEEEAEEAEARVRRTRKAVAEAEESKERLFERARRPEVEDPQAMSIAEKIVARLDKSAEDALARIRKRRAEGRMYAIPAEDMIDYAIYGAAKMGKLSLIHAKSFSRWSAEMIAEIGDFIRPDLKEIWDESEKIRQKEVEALGEEKAYEPVKKILGRYDEKTTVNRGDTARQLIKPAGPRGKWTPQQAKAIWNYARKMYIDRGEIDFDVVRHNVATDLGMSVKDVTAAMAATKTLKRMTDEMYKRYADRRRIINEARNWLKNQEYPGWKRFARKVPRVFFSAKIFGHGTVGLITHAGNMVFDPYSWKVYFPQWREMYRFVFGSEAYHERAMKDLQLDPLFVTAKRAGLQNDPFKYTDDYQISAITKFFARGLGNRGFDALKTLRQARFNQAWNGLPESLKTPEMASLIADSVNHATGIVKTRFREWANWAFFAPKLEASRWSFMLRDPYVAAETFARWDQMSPERRHMAIMEVKSKASIIGIYAAMLAMNQGFLSAIGSDQEINYTNPLRSDFLAFKVAGFRIGIVSPIIGMIRMFSNIIKGTYGRETKLSKLETERERAYKEAGKYITGKESPFAAAATTAFFGRDFMGRPVPWSTKKVQPRLRRMGVEPFSWGEYVAETALPIPFEEAAREAGPDIYEAAKEVWQGQGMQQEHIDKIWRGLVIAGSMAATGARVTEDVYRGR